VLATLVPLQAALYVLAPLAATAVVLSRDPLRQVVVNGFYGIVLAILFYVLQAPDVALSMIVVGGIAYPLVVLVSIARVRSSVHHGEEEDDG